VDDVTNDVRGAARQASVAPGLETPEALRDRIVAALCSQVGKSPASATPRDWFVATAYAIRGTALGCWLSQEPIADKPALKQVCYLSIEFLIGRLLMDTIGNLGLADTVRSALAQCGVDLAAVAEEEPDAALGNGGLGRLAACLMESMATVGVPAIGYGIRYEFGCFMQEIRDGVQRELPEDWLRLGNPWEFPRGDIAWPVGFGGHVADKTSACGKHVRTWHPAETVLALAYDTPVVGDAGRHVNKLRLWSARALTPMKLEEFNRGDHLGALREQLHTEAISRVLYPSDETDAGKELRLRQEYFFVSASLQDIVSRHADDLDHLADRVAIQLNDTHPAIGVVELMRVLIDVHGMDWDRAWKITVACFGYTNHTLLPEALETWSVTLMERLLPRHMQIIYLLNEIHLKAARQTGADDAVLARVSLIDESNGRRVRMGNLSFLGSHSVNGVSALHSQLVQRHLFRDMDALYPGRISNQTNGITFRRWLNRTNPGLTRLLVDTLGDAVLHDPAALEGLGAYADDAWFQSAFAGQRMRSKQVLTDIIADRVGIAVDPAALFDVQIKRIHEYKRQLLNILQTVALYRAMRAEPQRDWTPRVKLFAGKAAPGYARAKEIIRLAHDVARVVNADKAIGGRLKLVYLPNYNVSLAERIIPAADLSEQISTAGMEASGTGNMKFALNGALTIGTLDGANVEIRDHVGADNIFIFGMTVEQVEARTARGLDAHDAVSASPMLKHVLEDIAHGVFSPDEPGRYRGLVDRIVTHDAFMTAADFASYCAAQAEVGALWRDKAGWWRMAVLNAARMGWFSSDRTIRGYAKAIWGVPAA
jgi:starch phosphorylase